MTESTAKLIPCRCLKTKNPYGTSPASHEDWHPTVKTTSTYWCLNTMSFAGPDDQFAHLSRCVSGRGCYQQPEE
jgi:hypothetical protein